MNCIRFRGFDAVTVFEFSKMCMCTVLNTWISLFVDPWMSSEAPWYDMSVGLWTYCHWLNLKWQYLDRVVCSLKFLPGKWTCRHERKQLATFLRSLIIIRTKTVKSRQNNVINKIFPINNDNFFSFFFLNWPNSDIKCCCKYHMGLEAKNTSLRGLRTAKAQTDQRLCYSLFVKYHI